MTPNHNNHLSTRDTQAKEDSTQKNASTGVTAPPQKRPQLRPSALFCARDLAHASTSPTRSPGSPTERLESLRFSLPLRFPFRPFLLPLRTDDFHPDKPSDRCSHRPNSPPQPGRGSAGITTGPKVDLNLSFRLQVLGVELNRTVLLLPLRFYQKRIAKIVVMEMKRRLVMSTSICLDDLPIRNLGIFDKNIGVGDSLAIRPTNIPFNGEAMVGLMGGRDHGRNYGTLCYTEYEST
jgi:hypothetical protein